MTVKKILNSYLLEMVVKSEKGFKIRLESGKLQPKVYSSVSAAVRVILGLKSKGGFYNKPKSKQKQMVANYIKKHKLTKHIKNKK